MRINSTPLVLAGMQISFYPNTREQRQRGPYCMSDFTSSPNKPQMGQCQQRDADRQMDRQTEKEQERLRRRRKYKSDSQDMHLIHSILIQQFSSTPDKLPQQQTSTAPGKQQSSQEVCVWVCVSAKEKEVMIYIYVCVCAQK